MQGGKVRRMDETRCARRPVSWDNAVGSRRRHYTFTAGQNDAGQETGESPKNHTFA